MVRKIIIAFVLLVIFFLPQTPAKTYAQQASIDPQYLFMHKYDAPWGCCGWYQNRPETITRQGIDDITTTIGTLGTTHRKLGVSYTFSYNKDDISLVKQSLANFLNASKETGIPISVHLDGFEWLEAHPEIWNWWDPSQPGYNPANRDNVEWTSWDSSTATKIAWRNWAKQVRVLPHPNISSPAFMSLSLSNLRQLVSLISTWYTALPDDKKYLLGSVVIGWETNIGINYYYYPNGNSYLSQPPANDPTTGLAGSVQLGYAAVKTAGIKSSGALTSADLDAVVNRYLTTLTKETYALGIPRDKIYTHIGAAFGTEPTNNVWVTARAGILDYAQPGYSFYDTAANPLASAGLSGVLDAYNNTPWGAVEWNDWTHDSSTWQTSLATMFASRNNKVIDFFNWSAHPTAAVIQTFKNILHQEPACWVTAPKLLPITYNGNTATFRWIPGSQNSVQHILVTSYPELSPNGMPKRVNLINDVATGTSYQHAVSPSTIYWTVVVDGCNTTQRRVANVAKAVLTASGSTSTPAPLLAADLNNNQSVEPLDFNILMSNFGKTGSPNFIPSDINDDGKVDIFDYNQYVTTFGSSR